jgi:type I restriction enzyme S subunit
MEVRPSHKQTEVGVIPEDWAVSPLENFTSFISYGFTNPMPTSESGIYMITAKDINHGRIQFDTARCTTKEAYRTLLTAKSRPKKGDLLLTKDGTLGRLALVDDRTVCINQSIAILRPNAKAVPQFLKVLLEAPEYQNRMLEDAGGSTIKHIYITIVNWMPVAVPPTKAEQEAIAEALSDADDLIESLEQLLAKKRHLKRGAMQELLTGERRLPGFRGEWEVKRLGDCFALVSSRNTELNDNVVTMSAQQGFVRQEEFFKKRVASSSLENYYLIERGHFAYNRSYSNGYPFGAIKRLTEYDKGVVTTLYICFALKPEAESDPTFFEHYFEAGLLNSGLSTVTNEGGRAHGLLNIAKADFFSREVRRPPLSEQTAVAAILSDMDAEIAALEGTLVKASQLKQGMMQELLTGRTRLI